MMRLGYLMSRFPHLPETFILREMIELQRLGWDIRIYPLILQRQNVQHGDVDRLWKQTTYIPFFSFEVLVANLKMFFTSPGKYCVALVKSLGGNLSSPKFFLRTLALFPKAAALSQQLQKDGVTHLHVHYATHPAMVAWIIHQLTGISYSVTAHAHDIYVNHAMLAAKLHDAAFVVTISEFNRRYLENLLGKWISPKIHIIRCGIRPENYSLIETESEDKKRFRIISIGSLQPYKGHKYLVDACEILRGRGIPVHCVIVGGGELKSDLYRQITSYCLEDSVKLLGPQPQELVSNYLAEADCFVQPSIITPSGKMEGLPVALMEALACNLPVVATNISGIPELVRSGETGLLVEPEDSLALADALENIYRDPAKARRMATHGRDLVLDEFNLYRNVEKLSVLFDGAGQMQQSTNLPFGNSPVLSSPNMEE